MEEKEINLNQNEPFALILQQSRILFDKNRTPDRFLSPKKELLIKDINIVDVKVSNSYCIILDNLGRVYYLKNDNIERFVDKFLDGDSYTKPQLINFTTEDPIKKIFGKFSDLTVLVSEKENIYIVGSNTFDSFKINQYLEDGIKFKKEFINNENIVDAACGEVHMLLLTESGKIFGFGVNGLLGNEKIEITELKIDHIPSKIVKIYATDSNIFALTEGGELYSCGEGEDVVNGMERDRVYDPYIFTKISIEERVVEVYNGYTFVAVKTIDSKVYVFGFNNLKQLGKIQTVRDDNLIYGPTLLNTFNTNEIKEMDCGFNGSVIITKEQPKVFVSGSFSGFLGDDYENYTEIDLKKFIGNNNNHAIFSEESNFELKVRAGKFYVVLFATKQVKTIGDDTFNSEKSWKLSDVTFTYEN
ncbi:hypothetical protein ABK040_006199 [Willaertia magna]